jgi:transposase
MATIASINPFPNDVRTAFEAYISSPTYSNREQLSYNKWDDIHTILRNPTAFKPTDQERKNLNAKELDAQVTKAVLGVQSGEYKSSYEASKQLGLSPNTVTRRVNGGLSRSQARQQQQKLSYEQESVLLKWIKQLTVSGYSPGHRLLKEIAEELRTKRTYDLDDASLDSLELLPQYTLGQDWVPRFILQHPHLTVAIGRRIESIRMDGATKEVLNAWFDAYKKVVQECKIAQENTYNMDEFGFSIGIMESTRIILDSTLRTKHQAHPGRQEWVSMVESTALSHLNQAQLIRI